VRYGEGGNVDIGCECEGDKEIGGYDLDEVRVDKGPEGEGCRAVENCSSNGGRKDEEVGVEC
jgi:hypothetical protein